MTIDEIAHRFANARREGAGYRACCSAHDDGTPSLTITPGDGGRVLLKCRSRDCRIEDILDRAGLTMGDIMGNGSATPRTPPLKPWDSPAAYIDYQCRKHGWKHGGTWAYRRADGTTHFQVIRFNLPDGGKQFRPLYPAGGGWIPSDPPGALPLYNLPAVIAADRVQVHEGEKAADEAIKLGFTATTSAHGSKSPQKTDWTPLAGKRVDLYPDHDEPGEKYTATVAGILMRLNPPARVRIVRLPDLPPGGDIVEFVEAHDSTETDDLRRMVESIADAAPELTAAPAVESEGPEQAVPEAPLVPLDYCSPPAMPAGMLPEGWFANMTEALAAALEVPRELPTGLGLAVLATACQKTFSVRVEPGYFEALPAWTAPALPSGGRKTAVVNALTAPLIDWEREQAQVYADQIAKAESEAKTTQARITHLRNKAAKGGEGFQEIKEEIAQLEASMPVVPKVPRAFTQDVTPEHLGTMLADNGARLGILSDEAGLFELMAGRYSNGVPNLDLYLQSYTGTAVRVDRGSRPSVVLDHPALSIGVSPQPDVLRGLAMNKAFRFRGLLARFWFLLPESRLGYRTLESRPVPEHITAAYTAGIRALIDTPPAVGDNGQPHPRTIFLHADAHTTWKVFQREVETDMRPGGRFEHCTDWGGKLPGAIARIAGLIHCAQFAHDGPEKYPIDVDTMSRAIELGKLFALHALAVFDLMGRDPATEAARRVLAWVERERRPLFSRRDCWHDLRGTFKTVSEIEPAWELLQETGHLREHAGSGDRKAGRPSPAFIVNPEIVAKWGVSS
ncbi:MAG: hypothetical protein AMXMBFR13_22370 [Phycisphaerae bacterium]